VNLQTDWINLIDQDQSAMESCLVDWAEINSYSYNTTGLNKTLDAFQAEFQRSMAGSMCKFSIEKLELSPEETLSPKGEKIFRELAPCLKITKSSLNNGAPNILLMGHLDTVYPPELGFDTCRKLDQNTLNGPGVADLKGGLIIMLKALEYFEKYSKHADKLNWQIFLNSDEEIGSPSSSIYFPQLAQKNNLALIFEPSLSDGSVAYRRKGTGNFTIVFRGKSAHVGRDFKSGINALLLASEFTTRLYKLNEEDESLIINPGKLNSGGPLNVVPDLAILGLNVRIENQQKAQFFLDSLAQIKTQIESEFQGSQVEIYGRFNRVPKIPDQKTDELLLLIQSCARELGQEIGSKNTGGACDGNNLMDLGLPNIDSLGVRGGKIHSTDEFVHLESLSQRAKLIALVLDRLARG
jgi:glutamate carboxypeptidase